jgi:hypothetical protein
LISSVATLDDKEDARTGQQMNGWDCLAHVADDGAKVAVSLVPLAALWLRDQLKKIYRR